MIKREKIEQEIVWLEDEVFREVKSLVYNLSLKNARIRDAVYVSGALEHSARVVSERKHKIEALRMLLDKGVGND